MKIYDTIIANGAVLCYNNLASRLSTFKTGGAIDLLIEPTSYDGLIATLQLLEGERYRVVGNCSNILVDDSGYHGVMLSTRRVKGSVIADNTITANCGESLTTVASIAKKNSLSGMEELALIPGTIGGAVCMNAGAYRRNISDITASVTAYRKGYGIVEMRCCNLQFDYRNSIFKTDPDYIVLAATFALSPKNKALISMRMQELACKRRAMQPELPSLGSVFKKVGDMSAGYYIEQAGLKGHMIGGAMISDKHANFIVNNGGATSADYKSLVDIAKRAVKNMFDIDLDQEVIFI